MSVKGSHLTEETKTKISLGMKGKKNSLGHHQTGETKAKRSRALRGRVMSEEERAKHMGHLVSEETRAKIRQSNLGKTHSAMKGNKYALGYRFTEEQRDNLSRAKKALGYHHTEKAKAKIRCRLMGNKNGLGNRSKMGKVPTQETRAKLSLAGLGREDTVETRVKKSQSRIGMKFTEEHKANLSKDQLSRWKDPEYRDRVIKTQRLGCHIHPNKAEIVLLELLELEYPNEWRFVGDGSLIIGGKNPDFANVNGQKALIELFGNYWHKGEDPQERIDLFRQYGYKMLIIWESELEHPEEVLEKIAGFLED